VCKLAEAEMIFSYVYTVLAIAILFVPGHNIKGVLANGNFV